MNEQKKINILMASRSAENEAKRHLKNDTEIFFLDDAIKNFKEYFIDPIAATMTEEGLKDEQEYFKELKIFLESKKYLVMKYDMQIVSYDGVDYLIKYCL